MSLGLFCCFFQFFLSGLMFISLISPFRWHRFAGGAPLVRLASLAVMTMMRLPPDSALPPAAFPSMNIFLFLLTPSSESASDNSGSFSRFRLPIDNCGTSSAFVCEWWDFRCAQRLSHRGSRKGEIHGESRGHLAGSGSGRAWVAWLPA